MKNLVFLFLLLPTTCFSQRILRSQYDKYLKQYVIETTVVNVRFDITEDILGFAIRSQDSSIFLIAAGVGGAAGVVNYNQKLVLYLTNGDSVSLNSAGVQDFQRGEIADSYSHNYNASQPELLGLQKAPLLLIRMFTINGATDIKVKEKRSKHLNELITVFLAEYNTKKTQF